MKVASSTQQTQTQLTSGDVRAAQRAQDAKKANRASKTDGPSKVSSREMTELSGKSKELAQAKLVASHTPEIRENRVMELKKQIDAGTYKVDPELIAERLLNEHLDTPELN